MNKDFLTQTMTLSAEPSFMELRYEALVSSPALDTMAIAAKLGWQPYGHIDRKLCIFMPDAVAGSPAALLQGIRRNAEEDESAEEEVNVDIEIVEADEIDDEMQTPELFEKEAPFCDGEVPTAFILAMAEMHNGEQAPQLKRWMESEGRLSAINVVAGRVQDVHNSISAVRRSLMMHALAEIGSPLQMIYSQEPTQQALGCEVCEASVIKRWKIVAEPTGKNEVAEKMFNDVLKKKMIVEPATWSQDIEEAPGKKPAPVDEKGPDKLAASRSRKLRRESDEAALRQPLSEGELREAELVARAAGTEALSSAETTLKHAREFARKCLRERGLMVCRSCASKATTTQPGIATILGIDFTGVKGKNPTRRDAFAEWVAAANGSWEKVLPKAVVETSDSRRADVFNRNDKERSICGQAVILKDGRCGQIVTVAKLADGGENFAFFRQQGKRSSKGIDNCEPLRLKTAFAALTRAQEQRNRRTCLPETHAAMVDESEDDLSETMKTAAEHDDSDDGGEIDETHETPV